MKEQKHTDFFITYWSEFSTHYNFFGFFCSGSKPTDSKTKMGSGLSCLMSSTTDEDLPVLPKSPEKRSLLSVYGSKDDGGTPEIGFVVGRKRQRNSSQNFVTR
jgi:hypothetical protein